MLLELFGFVDFLFVIIFGWDVIFYERNRVPWTYRFLFILVIFLYFSKQIFRFTLISSTSLQIVICFVKTFLLVYWSDPVKFQGFPMEGSVAITLLSVILNFISSVFVTVHSFSAFWRLSIMDRSLNEIVLCRVKFSSYVVFQPSMVFEMSAIAYIISIWLFWLFLTKVGFLLLLRIFFESAQCKIVCPLLLIIGDPQGVTFAVEIAARIILNHFWYSCWIPFRKFAKNQ